MATSIDDGNEQDFGRFSCDIWFETELSLDFLAIFGLRQSSPQIFY